jgi:hypothetical protein
MINVSQLSYNYPKAPAPALENLRYFDSRGIYRTVDAPSKDQSSSASR